MKTSTRWAVSGLAAAVVIVGGAGVATATGVVGDDDGQDVPITGEALEQASAAALAETGGGRVTETEVGDEEGYYEVEVTLEDGSEVDVHLDESFAVLDVEREDDDEDDEDVVVP